LIPIALTIAGSDPSGGAGIQADLKTFSALKVYGMSVITALTAQNTIGVSGLLEVNPAFVADQLDAVLSDIVPGAAKTGMLANAAIVEIVATKIRQYGVVKLVVDPVMISTSGSTLLADDAIDALSRLLLPLAQIVMPNIDEARVLSRRDVRDVHDMEEAARRIHGLGARYVYIKGGHLGGDAIDVLFDGVTSTRLHGSRIVTDNTHGTGCILSAAMAANLALGLSVPEAVVRAKDFVTLAIRNSLRLGAGSGPCDPLGIEPRE